ncbi:MAG: hypothetical protein ACXW2P_13015 [Thermoanaerobaculia bacterium]
MRATFVFLALALTMSVVAVGQQALPGDLPTEPATLPDAAALNNFPRFTALYESNPSPEYADLHRFWTWSMQDSLGGFYGVAEYEQFASRYPSYAAYMDRYRIVDSNGNAFYPSAETRRFLLSEALAGTVPVKRAAPAPVRASRATPVSPVVATVASAPPPAPASAPPPTQLVTSPTVVLVAPEPAGEVARAPQPEPLPVRGAVRRNEADRGALTRGILLMIAGLLGIGMISMALHAPQDEEPRNLTRHTP